MKLTKINAPLLIILLGVFFSLFLFSRIPDEVFFSGDAGLKALLAKQFSVGNLNFNLDLPVPSWADNLWNRGLYPFEPPFTYKISNRYYITFPFTFPLLTAPFYAVLGFRGFYVVPLISTWIIWFSFYRLCQFFQLGVIITSVALATLIFASPLSMYSAMYWEHTLAVALAFSGLVIIFSKGRQSFSTKDAVTSGVLIGLAVWFRPEFLVLVAILILLVVASFKIKLELLEIITNKKLIFLASMITSILCFFVINQLIYSHPLGAHALQVVEAFSPRTRLVNAQKFFIIMGNSLLKYFPVTYFIVIFVGLSVFSNVIKLTTEMRQILLISILFVSLVPILLPSDGGKQWGPRFLLILIPLLNILAILTLQFTLSIKKLGLRYFSSALFAALFVVGFHLNTYSGTLTCYSNKSTETLDVLNFLRKDSNKIVSVAHQYVSQTFESAFQQKIFFLTKTSDDISQLSLALHQQGLQKFIYICPFYDSCFASPKIPDTLDISGSQKPLSIRFTPIEKNKRYIIREAEIIEKK